MTLASPPAPAPAGPPPSAACAPPSGPDATDVHANGCMREADEAGRATRPAPPPTAPGARQHPARPPKPPPSPARHPDLPGRLCIELERKLRLAAEAAELSSDRDAICGEAFSDLVGALDRPARAALLVPGTSAAPGEAGQEPDRPVLYYEVLAPYLASHPARAEGLLTVAKRLWGQPYVAPLYTLLLHRWLLAAPQRGGRRGAAASSSSSHAAALLGEARHLLVLVRGAQQLFWADVHAGGRRFEPLFSWLVRAVVLAGPAPAPPPPAPWSAPGPATPPPPPAAARLGDLPFNPRVGLINVTAAFAPYYLGAADLAAALEAWPSAAAAEERARPGTGTRALTTAATATPATATPTLPQHASGAATLLTEAADMLGLMKGEAGLLAYLAHLRGWAGSGALGAAPRGARLRLQAELYGLTARGGLRYLPPSVREAAFAALDDLFPAGRAPRRAVAAAVRLWLHPAALPAVAAEAALTAAGWASGAVRVAAGAAGAVVTGLGLGGGGGLASAHPPSTREGMGEGGALSRMMVGGGG